MEEIGRKQQDAVVEQEKQQTTNLLNQSQRRSLATVLRRVEFATWRLEDRITRGASPQLALTRFTLNEPESPAALALILTHILQIDFVKEPGKPTRTVEFE